MGVYNVLFSSEQRLSKVESALSVLEYVLVVPSYYCECAAMECIYSLAPKHYRSQVCWNEGLDSSSPTGGKKARH